MRLDVENFQFSHEDMRGIAQNYLGSVYACMTDEDVVRLCLTYGVSFYSHPRLLRVAHRVLSQRVTRWQRFVLWLRRVWRCL